MMQTHKIPSKLSSLIMWGLALTLICLTGCAKHPKPEPITSPAHIVKKELKEAVAEIQESLSLLAKIEQAESWKHEVPVSSYKLPNGPLAEHLTMDWSGDLLPAVQTVATLVGFGTTEVGKPPTVPAIVTVHATDLPAFRILEDIGWQAGKHIVITVDPAQKIIQVTYVGQDS